MVSGNFREKPDYSDLLNELTSTPEERRSILHGYLEPTEDEREQGLKVPTAAHRAIARLVRDGFIRVILTTNFDRLTEQALSAEGIAPTVISSDDSLKGAVPLIHSPCTVVKLHGDYLDTRIKNTEEELSEYSADMNQFLDRILDDHGLIVCGWSAGWDTALRVALMRAPNRRYGMFWAQVGTLTDHASDVIRHRQADVIKIEGADAFLGTLADQVQALEDRKTVDPQNITLLLATVKYYIPRSECRVKLSDVIDTLYRDLRKKMAESALSVGSLQKITDRIIKLDKLSEAMVRSFGIILRYDAIDIKSCISFIEGLSSELEKRESATESSVSSNYYPALLFFYGCGLSLIFSGKMKDLYNWLTFDLKVGTEDRLPSSGCFRFKSSPKQFGTYWREMEGCLDSPAPLSKHLFDLFSEWIFDLIIRLYQKSMRNILIFWKY